jgi:hypothetical protein
MITDLSNYRLGIARQCGLELSVNPNEADLSAAVTRAFGPDRPDLILECVGINQTTEQGIQNARKGTDIIIVGVFSQKATVDLGRVQDRELRIIGTLMHQEGDYRKAVDLITTGKVNLSPLITNHFPFEQYLEAYRFIDEKKDRTMKVIIDVQQEVSHGEFHVLPTDRDQVRAGARQGGGECGRRPRAAMPARDRSRFRRKETSSRCGQEQPAHCGPRCGPF